LTPSLATVKVASPPNTVATCRLDRVASSVANTSTVPDAFSDSPGMTLPMMVSPGSTAPVPPTTLRTKSRRETDGLRLSFLEGFDGSSSLTRYSTR
jgi:hypothetical protein